MKLEIGKCYNVGHDYGELELNDIVKLNVDPGNGAMVHVIHCNNGAGYWVAPRHLTRHRTPFEKAHGDGSSFRVVNTLTGCGLLPGAIVELVTDDGGYTVEVGPVGFSGDNKWIQIEDLAAMLPVPPVTAKPKLHSHTRSVLLTQKKALERSLKAGNISDADHDNVAKALGVGAITYAVYGHTRQFTQGSIIESQMSGALFDINTRLGNSDPIPARDADKAREHEMLMQTFDNSAARHAIHDSLKPIVGKANKQALHDMIDSMEASAPRPSRERKFKKRGD